MKLCVLSVIMFHLAFSLSGCGRSEEQIKADEIKAEKSRVWLEKSRVAEENIKKARIEGVAALAEADNAIRDEAADRRARLVKASKSVRTTNRDGVRVDQYILKRGGVIACTTTISGNSPAMFNCDGDV